MAEGVVIRPERDADHPVIAEVVRTAFAGHPDEVASFEPAVMVEGVPAYYPRFGFERASALGFISRIRRSRTTLSWSSGSRDTAPTSPVASSIRPRSTLSGTKDRGHELNEEETMHAALLTLTIDPEQAPAAANALTQDILPRLRSAPGFVAGYWLEPVDGRGFSFVVFETEEQARQATPPASDWAAPGVSIDEVDFRRLALSAAAASPPS